MTIVKHLQKLAGKNKRWLMERLSAERKEQSVESSGHS